jgi:hypothetical protein
MECRGLLLVSSNGVGVGARRLKWNLGSSLGSAQYAMLCGQVDTGCGSPRIRPNVVLHSFLLRQNQQHRQLLGNSPIGGSQRPTS